MEFALFVWLASVIGSVSSFLNGLGLCMLVSICAWVFLNFTSRGEYQKEYKPEVYENAGNNLKSKLWKFGVFIAVMFMFLASVIPSQKTLYIMAGAYAGQKALQSETAGKVLTIVNSKLDEYIAEAEKSLKK